MKPINETNRCLTYTLSLLFVLTLIAVTGTNAAAEFSELKLYVELNNTDGDLGLHSLIDGDAYRTLEIKAPSGAKLLKVSARGRLAKQGLTELFFESAEPPFDEVAPEKFFRRFPAGLYRVQAKTLDGEKIHGSTELSHILAAPPSNITVSGVPAAANCDVDPLPEVSRPVVIDWDPVTTSHPTIGSAGSVTIAQYQLFVEKDDIKLGIDLPPSVTRFEVPEDLIDLGTEFKYEIIATTNTGNNTAIESCFVVE